MAELMQETTLLVGTYTTGTDSRGVYRLRMRNGVLLAPELALEARDPSYLLRRGEALYWVDEALDAQSGCIGWAQRCGDGYVRWGTADTQGQNPCHLALSPSGQWLAAANYTSGQVALYRIGADGAWEKAGLFPGAYAGPDPLRQGEPHAHFVAFCSEEELLCCDLGGDCLRKIVRAGESWRETEPMLFFPAGSGPRHMVLAGEIAYVLCELSGELMTIDLNAGELLNAQYILREPAQGTAAALRLAPDGRLLASHRGADTISVFSLENPRLPRLCEVAKCGGKGPRDFWPMQDGSIVCACQQENALSVLKRGEGGYRAVQWIALPAPVCVIEE